MACRNRRWPIHRLSSTSVRCMTAICPAGPPKVCSEMANQVRTAVRNGMAGCGRPDCRRSASLDTRRSSSVVRGATDSHIIAPERLCEAWTRQDRSRSRRHDDRSNGMEPVRFGLVGYGCGGRWFHAPLLSSAPECELIGVVTSSPERRDLVAREQPGVATSASLEELAAAGAEAVSISTPADTHTVLSEQAPRVGLAVVCAKPFAPDAAAARGTVELAEQLRLPLAPYQNRRWDSDFRTVRALAADGALGRLIRFESRFEGFAPEAGPPAVGGGSLLDFGSHLVDQSLVLLGPVASVYAEWRLRDDGVDDDV